jgi:phosphoserine phosphatase RsbU/P
MSDRDRDDELTPFPFRLPSPTGAGPAPEDAGTPRTKILKTIKVLLVEDSRGDARLIQEYLGEVEGLQFEVENADRLAQGLARQARGGIDVVLLDLSLPDSRGLDTFLQFHAAAPGVPIVVLTGFNDEVLAVKAVQEGAEDYLVKGYVNSNLLARSLRYAIERTRRRTAERALRATEEKIAVAREIQQKLFPAAAPALAGFEIAGASFPADATGGDYFDYLRFPDGSLGVVIADVTGHGFGPALLMAATRAYLRALAQTYTDVGMILTVANRVLAEDIGDDRFVTLVLARLNPDQRSLVYVSAGHPTGYLFSASGQVKKLLQSTAIPLGVLPTYKYVSSEPLELDAGDLVVLLTDGIAEARTPEQAAFGVERVLDIIRFYRAESPRRIVDHLYQAVRAFAEHARQCDDITAVVLKVEGESLRKPGERGA